MATQGNRACVMVLAFVCAASAVTLAQAPSTKNAPAGNVTTGQQLFMKKSCYYCHGTEGQGSIAGVGPRVALVARSFDSFSRYVRRPTGRMTAYSEKILSDTELSDIYAFLRSLPAARAVSDIPLLEQLRKR